MAGAGAEADAEAATGKTEIDYSFWSDIPAEFTTRAFVLIPIAIGFNVLGGTIVRWLKLPMFMDVIGTVLLAMIAGVWVAAVAGLLTNVLLGVTASPSSIPFGLVQVAIALVAGFLATRGWFQINEPKEYLYIVAAGFILAITSTVTATPIQVIVFGGFTGGAQDAAVGALMATGSSIVESVFTTQIFMDTFDKMISIIVAYLVAIQIPKQYLPPLGQMVLGE